MPSRPNLAALRDLEKALLGRIGRIMFPKLGPQLEGLSWLKKAVVVATVGVLSVGVIIAREALYDAVRGRPSIQIVLVAPTVEHSNGSAITPTSEVLVVTSIPPTAKAPPTATPPPTATVPQTLTDPPSPLAAIVSVFVECGPEGMYVSVLIESMNLPYGWTFWPFFSDGAKAELIPAVSVVPKAKSGTFDARFPPVSPMGYEILVMSFPLTEWANVKAAVDERILSKTGTIIPTPAWKIEYQVGVECP